ncbi:hypothetical protein FBUS_05252 [Fasciolopsis buskii]|uniref:UBA domain-containing protein n=1 Tax=Fasciolopsis buskii TaxID=27845 RepID=A0A8E0RR23_9TREM|nr:hypothetical protein FBUS_05252 [Fasciolopsis buski]
MSEGAVAITVKIICPTESGKLFQTHSWKICEPSWDALYRKVQEVITLRSVSFRLSWWNVDHYEEVRDDSSFTQAVEHWLVNSQTSSSIYVTLPNTEPKKVYGRIPYDCLANESESFNHRRRSRWKLFGHKEKTKRSQSMYQSPSNSAYFRPHLSSIADHPSSSKVMPIDGSRTTQCTSTMQMLSPVINNSVNNEPLSQATVQDNTDDGMRLAVETLRSMGFQHDRDVLEEYILQTGGNLNEIIDLLQAHDFQWF